MAIKSGFYNEADWEQEQERGLASAAQRSGVATLLQADHARAQALEAALRLDTATDADSLIAIARRIEAYLTGKETA